MPAGPHHGGAPGRPLRVRGGAQLLQRPGDSALDVRHQGDSPPLGEGGVCNRDGVGYRVGQRMIVVVSQYGWYGWYHGGVKWSVVMITVEVGVVW